MQNATLGTLNREVLQQRAREELDGDRLGREGKVRATFNLSRELVEEARDTVVALSGPPHRLTLAKLAEIALRNELDRLRGQRAGRSRHQAFPARTERVRSGRPIS